MSIPESQTKWPAGQSLQPLDEFSNSVDVIIASHTSPLEVQATVHIPHGTFQVGKDPCRMGYGAVPGEHAHPCLIMLPTLRVAAHPLPTSADTTANGCRQSTGAHVVHVAQHRGAELI